MSRQKPKGPNLDWLTRKASPTDLIQCEQALVAYIHQESVDVATLEPTTSLLRALLPFLKSQNDRWGSVSEKKMTTSSPLVNKFWYQLRKKLSNKEQLKQEVNDYKQKMAEVEEEDQSEHEKESASESEESEPSSPKPEPE